MAKQRQSAVPAAVMHLVKPRWQAKSRATPRALLKANSRVMRRALLQANSQVKPAPLEANSRAIRRVLFQANSRVKTADPPSPGLRRASGRPPLLELPVKVKLLVQQAAKRPLREPQD
jgi:hypothetical protein